jgi:hypothetical protein
VQAAQVAQTTGSQAQGSSLGSDMHALPVSLADDKFAWAFDPLAPSTLSSAWMLDARARACLEVM